MLPSSYMSIILSTIPHSPDIPTHVLGPVVFLLYIVALYIHARDLEWLSRLDFIWQDQVSVTDILIYDRYQLMRHKNIWKYNFYEKYEKHVTIV